MACPFKSQVAILATVHLEGSLMGPQGAGLQKTFKDL